MGITEVLELIALWRKEDIQTATLYEDRLMRLGRDRFNQLRTIGVERKLKRSYSTIKERSR